MVDHAFIGLLVLVAAFGLFCAIALLWEYREEVTGCIGCLVLAVLTCAAVGWLVRQILL